MLLIHGANPFFCRSEKVSPIVLALQQSPYNVFALLLKECAVDAISARNVYESSLFYSFEKQQSY